MPATIKLRANELRCIIAIIIKIGIISLTPHQRYFAPSFELREIPIVHNTKSTRPMPINNENGSKNEPN